MFNIICVTNSIICKEDFLTQIEKICKSDISRIILREKYLPQNEYYALAVKVNEICTFYNKPLTIHNYPEVALKLNINSVHLPLNVLIKTDTSFFLKVGTSIHDIQQLDAAVCNGATYVTAGHVFETDCKKGLPPRGIPFLDKIIKHSPVPAFAIGGINHNNLKSVYDTNASGVCLMSSLMNADNPQALIENLLSTIT